MTRLVEDTARIIRSLEQLPEIVMTPAELARDLVKNHDIRALPNPEEPALLLADPGKREAIMSAYDGIAPMFWGPRQHGKTPQPRSSCKNSRQAGMVIKSTLRRWAPRRSSLQAQKSAGPCGAPRRPGNDSRAFPAATPGGERLHGSVHW